MGNLTIIASSVSVESDVQVPNKGLQGLSRGICMVCMQLLFDTLLIFGDNDSSRVGVLLPCATVLFILFTFGDFGVLESQTNW